MGVGSEGVEWGDNDARLNKLQSKGNVFKCSTWNYRGSNMERRSERVGSTGSDLPLSGQKNTKLGYGYCDEFSCNTK